MRRHAAIAVVLALVASVVAGSLGAGAAPSAPSNTKRERDQVRAAKAEVAANIDALEADQAELEAALAVLQENVAVEEGRLAEAERAVAEAKAQIERAQAGIEATETRLDELSASLIEVVVGAYMEPEGTGLSTLLESVDASDAMARREVRRAKTDRDADLAEQVRAAKATLEAERRAAAAAKERADAKEAEVAASVEKVREARAAQQKLVNGVQERINAQVDRSIELAAQDRELSAKLAREQAALQARLAAASAAQQRRQASAAAAYSDNGRETSGPVAGPGGVRPAGGSGSVSLCTVGGITVNCQISDRLQSLLSAAAADGVSLSGGGWRDPGAQVALRRQHCGSSNYAIYEMSASSCRPPTARPGQSMHEVGLAIDFSNCSSRSSACFVWLRANAASYGFYNLPSEPWHWSVNGN